MVSHDLRPSYAERQTAALLDVALANARRGEPVTFWSDTQTASKKAFARACELLSPSDTHGVTIRRARGGQEIAYANGGRVRFLWNCDPIRWSRNVIQIIDGDRHFGTAVVRRSCEGAQK